MRELIDYLITITKETSDYNTRVDLQDAIYQLLMELAWSNKYNWKNIGEELAKEYKETDNDMYQNLSLFNFDE